MISNLGRFHIQSAVFRPDVHRWQAPTTTQFRFNTNLWQNNGRTFSALELKPHYFPTFRKQASRSLHYEAPSKSDKDDSSALDVISEIDGKLWLSEAKYNQPHPVWTEHEMQAVERTHYLPQGASDWFALYLLKTIRTVFDICSGYKFWELNENGWMNRIIVLETVAGVPGLVGAGFRHLRSLRRMKPDYGWIHTLLEEAENERMHLMVALTIKQPGYIFRAIVLGGQLFFFPLFTTMYAISPKTAHRFVGYLEEEAVKTYTHLLDELKSGKFEDFRRMRAPKIGRAYWQLDQNATFEDMIYAIRADESHHRDVNHTFADLKNEEENPFPPGK